MRSPPMTSGYSRPSSPVTFASASSIADLFSGVEKSVSGSLRNSGRVDIGCSFQASGIASWTGAGRRREKDAHLIQIALPAATALMRPARVGLVCTSSALAQRARRAGGEPRLHARAQPHRAADRPHRQSRRTFPPRHRRAAHDRRSALRSAPARTPLQLSEKETVRISPAQPRPRRRRRRDHRRRGLGQPRDLASTTAAAW